MGLVKIGDTVHCTICGRPTTLDNATRLDYFMRTGEAFCSQDVGQCRQATPPVCGIVVELRSSTVH